MSLNNTNPKDRYTSEAAESLIGVDCKHLPYTKTNTNNKFYNRRQFQSYQQEETKFVKSVVKNQKLLQDLTKFQPKGLLKREINCTEDKISVRYSSPLDDTFDLQRNKCEDLIKEIGDSSEAKKCQPKVIAANLRWKNEVKVKQTTGKNYRNVTREASPTTLATYDFGSKTKFEKNVIPNICSELFPDGGIVVLNGNDCHGEVTTNKTHNSQKGKNRDAELTYQSSSPYYNNQNEVTTVGEYIDYEEHKFLLVPSISKSGLDTDTDKRYIFPYCAKFMITVGKEKVKYEHTFQLQLALTQNPQHYGLVFTFPVNNNQEVHIVKSLISVYSIFPESAQQCNITTYTLESKSEAVQSKHNNPKSLVANFSSFLEANLREEKLIKMFFRSNFSISCDLAKSQNTNRRQSKLDHIEMKHKNKQEILKHVKADISTV